MAKISPILGEMSGSIAGNTFSHNKGGQYVRQRTVPINPTTSRQMAVRSALSTTARSWQALTQTQRDAWAAYAQANPVTDRLGNSITLSGASMHNRLNTKIRDFAGTPIATPPSSAPPVAPSTFTISANTAANVTVAFTPTPIGAANRVELWIAPPGGPGQNPNFNQARLVAYSAANQATAWTASVPWSLVTGQYINCWLRVVDSSGRSGPALRYRHLCT